MVKFPEPSPTHLASIPPSIRVLPAGTELWRIYFRGGPHPTLWNEFRAHGPTHARFDHQEPPPRVQTRRITYAARSGLTALAEVFQETRLIDRGRRDPWLVCFRTSRRIALLDLRGKWPTRAGASMVISSGQHGRAQRWSRVIYDTYPTIEGLWYPSSMHANAPAVALYERCEDALPHSPSFHRALQDPAILTLLKNAASDLGYGLV